MQKVKVGIIYGGRSVEHEVSIISALQALHALDQEKYQPVPIYISKQGVWYTGDELLDMDGYRNMNELLPKCHKVVFSVNHNEGRLIFEEKGSLFKKREEITVDLIIPVIHGTHGEDGCLQGLLELSGLPYAGPGVLGSSCGMDKIVMKAVLKEAGIPVTNYYWFYIKEWDDDKPGIVSNIEAKLKYPLIVKPANLGSSIGISKAKDRDELEEAISLAGSFTNRILVEEIVDPLREINCSVLGDPCEMEVSLLEEPVSFDNILSFKDKYLNNAKGMSGATRRIPADINDEKRLEIEAYAKKAFFALDGHGVCRIDFLVNSDNNKVYLNEVNTIPGSLSFYLWEPKGKDFKALMDDLVRLALKRKRLKDKTLYTYASNILAQKGFKGKK